MLTYLSCYNNVKVGDKLLVVGSENGKTEVFPVAAVDKNCGFGIRALYLGSFKQTTRIGIFQNKNVYSIRLSAIHIKHNFPYLFRIAWHESMIKPSTEILVIYKNNFSPTKKNRKMKPYSWSVIEEHSKRGGSYRSRLMKMC